ncbi:DUF1186 domain-containing protein [Sporolactobacillus sp. THM19-2]|uniref:DUF1186 domain-containing protein n=1 Tax=Sporolactobacillus sp. THM19-2 TaxID=2511171 RepID=UPI0010225CA1|nr:DUF1186 domain-containing protein [Sporolactobacillus sp. THM19-2]RYL87078.1 DUF1186 domain-containing protein [Sporolactobacillus sp. THM19-2]
MKQIIESIKYYNGTFPKDQLKQIIERKDEAIPFLIEIVEEVVKHPDEYEEKRIDLIYALYLLSQFRVKELFPLLVKILHLPDDKLDLILGDVLTEGTSRMLASVYNGDIQMLQQLIENKELDEFARGQGLSALVILALNGQIERERIVKYLESLLTEKLSDEHYYFNAHIINCCTDLYPQETYDSIKRVYAKGSVDTMVIGLKDVESVLQSTKEETLNQSRNNPYFQFIEDSIAEMEWWACFDKNGEKEQLLW